MSLPQVSNVAYRHLNPMSICGNWKVDLQDADGLLLIHEVYFCIIQTSICLGSYSGMNDRDPKSKTIGELQILLARWGLNGCVSAMHAEIFLEPCCKRDTGTAGRMTNRRSHCLFRCVKFWKPSARSTNAEEKKEEKKMVDRIYSILSLCKI